MKLSTLLPSFVLCTLLYICLVQGKVSATEGEVLWKCSASVTQSTVQVPWSLRVEENPVDNLTFALVEKPLEDCPGGFEEMIISLLEYEGFTWTEDGYLFNQSLAFPRQRYCIANITDDAIKVQACRPKCQDDDVCIRKCCGPGSSLRRSSDGSMVCAQTSKLWKPAIYSVLDFSKEIVPKPPIYFQVKASSCNKTAAVYSPDELSMALHARIRHLSSGEVLIRMTGNHEWERLQGEYCSDAFIHAENDDMAPYMRKETSDVALVCTPDDSNIQEWTIFFSRIYFGFYMISCTFALTTIIAYGLVWDTHGTAGWSVLTFTICQFFHFVTFGVAHGARGFYHVTIPMMSVACVINGVFLHYFEIAAYSWLNILSFDLLKTLRSHGEPVPRKRMSQYWQYAVYGFGVPFVIVTVGIALDLSYDIDDERLYRPQYGRELCAVDRTSFLQYTGGVNMALYGVTFFFTMLSIYKLCTLKRSTQNLATGYCSRSINHMKCYVKISILMGVTWSIDFIGWLVVSKAVPNWHWAVFDVGNIFQSVGIFLIFVCTNRMRKNLAERYKIFQVLFGHKPERSAEFFNQNLTVSTITGSQR